jgi:tetratricopeptide (TPR) repeat protein
MDAEQTRPQSDNFLHLIAWLDQNRKRAAIWAAGIAAVGAIAIIVISYQVQKEERASKALSSVRAPFSPTIVNPSDTSENYLKIAKEHSGTKAGSRALLLAATARYTEGKYADAQKLFEQFTREYGDSPWLAQAMFGIASSLDAQQKPTEAMAKYEDLRRRFPNEALIDEAKLALARLYEGQNRNAEAFKLYDELIKGNPFGGGLAAEAGLRQAELLEKYPDLKTNQPPAMSSMPPLMNITNQITRPATNRAGSNMVQVRPMTNQSGTNMVQIRPATNRPAITTNAGATLPPTGPTNPGAAQK